MPKARNISFRRIGLMVMAIVLPAASFFYLIANYGSANLRGSVNEYIGGAGTLMYFSVAYLIALMHWLPVWVISLIIVVLSVFWAFLRRESTNKTMEN